MIGGRHNSLILLCIGHWWYVGQCHVFGSAVAYTCDLKGFKTFETCFLQSVYNGLQKVSTNFLWSEPDGVGVILRKMFWVFCCRPWKMCLQLLLLLEKDSSIVIVQNTTQCYCFQLGPHSLPPTTFMENSLHSIQEGSWNKISYEHVRAEARSLATLADL